MVLAAVVASAISAVVAWLLAHPRSPLRVLDEPNERSLHAAPVPRTGGLAIVVGLVTGAGVLWTQGRMPVLVGAHGAAYALVALAMVSFIDDRRHIAAGWRLLVQTGVAAALVAALPGYTANLWLAAVALLFLVWMINLYNFMDGMDGFAGGMAVFGFGVLSLVAWQEGAIEVALACSLVMGASLGFLAQNFPPARLFMGDLGSTLLGALAGVTLLYFHASGMLPVWLGILIFSPFIVDATVTLIRRVLRGERIWAAHREHYYQRLVQRGWGHRKTVLAEYLLMALAASSAVMANGLPLQWQWAIMGIWVLIYAVLMYAIDRTEPNSNEKPPV